MILEDVVSKGTLITSESDDNVPDDRQYKWEIEPNPYDSDYDIFATDDDQTALDALQAAAERAWDTSEEGQEKILKIRLYEVADNAKSLP